MDHRTIAEAHYMVARDAAHRAGREVSETELRAKADKLARAEANPTRVGGPVYTATRLLSGYVHDRADSIGRTSPGMTPAARAAQARAEVLAERPWLAGSLAPAPIDANLHGRSVRGWCADLMRAAGLKHAPDAQMIQLAVAGQAEREALVASFMKGAK